MRIAILTFEGCNELDSFIASARLNRTKAERVTRARAAVMQYLPEHAAA